MDLLTHTLSGIALGTVLSSFSKKGFKDKLKIISISGFGGALPDIDAISLWSGFDATFGKLFRLSNTGKTIYFSKFWYSHHGFFHSIVAGILIALCAGLAFYFIQTRFKNHRDVSFLSFVKTASLPFIGFISGYVLHLLEDMPTPSCDWGGVRLLWPLKVYFGGTGEIWWWNNYDIFLIILALILVNTLIISIQRLIKIDIRKLIITPTLIALTISIISIKTRNYNFNYMGQTTKYQLYEKKSKEIQRKILGDNLFHLMSKFDAKVRINF